MVAGESPDKSEKRKSPGETTSSERDPRLAVFGRAEAPDGEESVRVDQPTAVFTALPAMAAARTAVEAETPVADEDADVTPDGSPVDAEELAAPTVAADDEPESEPRSDPEPEPEPEPEPVSVADDTADTDAADAADGDGDADEAETGDKGRKDAGNARSGAAEAAEPTVAGEADGGAEDAEDADEVSAAPAPPVDQPTAVFQAFQRRTPVDQPTTAFKALTPERAKPADPEPKPSPEPKPEPQSAATPEPKATRDPASASAPASAPAPAGAASARPTPTWATADAPEKPAEPAAASSSDRAGTFVPLRSDDLRGARLTPSRPAAAVVGDTDEAGSAGAAVTPPSLTEAERTKQQPLPPRPPLDMLAELTNTPPPPPTPVRTLVRRVKIWTPLVVLLAIVFATVQMLRPLPSPTLNLSVDATYSFDGGKLAMPWPGEGQGAVKVEGIGQIGTYGPQEAAPTASVAKTMTAYLILKNHPIKNKDDGPQIEIDQLTEDQSHIEDWSRAPVKKGQKYTLGELLQLLMVQSANNVAHLLARWDAGTEEAFLKKMNDAAKELGMENTTYTDPSGFEKTTVSTPVDQLKLAEAAMQDKAFREIVDLPSVDLPQIGKTLYSGNSILLRDGVGGIKTGTSTPAGGNLLWAAYTKVDGKLYRILGIVMGVKSPAMLNEKTKLAIETYSYDLIKAAQQGVTSATVIKKGDVVGHIEDGLGGSTPVVATADLKPVGWAGLTVDLQLTDGGLPHAAAAGTEVGQVSVGSGEGKVSVPVALERELVEPGFGAKLARVG
ncbi:serine hydrolase [Streptomyces sp. NPDC047928]|uniref:D-alanyl-D-alanine carboxypeptidase n=1 Tax=unclassified Streptomyces TaxID=2593676 RepID=UPI003723F43E